MKKQHWTAVALCHLLAFAPMAAADKTPAKESIECSVSRYYKYRPDQTAAREAFITYHGDRPIKKAFVEVAYGDVRERTAINTQRHDSIAVLLPPGLGTEKDDTVWVSLGTDGKHVVSRQVVVPYARQWTVYIYPHSHVDIGYTNTQANVELIHKRNLDTAIDLAEQTKDYPEDARYVWNTEVVWPIDRYLKTEPKEKCDRLLAAIRNGQISVDAGYVHTNTSAASEEELFEFLGYGERIEALTGKKTQTLVQVDIPGMSWGIVSVAARLGINYCLALFNGFDRVGLTPDISFKPFWWVSPDGKQKVLFLQPGSYGPGAQYKGYMFWPKMAGQTDPDKLLRIVKTDHPRDHFIDGYLNRMLPELEKADYYPFDIFPMTWCMADNTPVDADLPEAVKSWNEEFAFPHLKICSATDIMQVFDQKYGDQLPQLKGDFTEYWTDGLGSAAAYTGKQREVKEQLVQTETLHSLINAGKPAPRADISETWRNIIMGSEHTWAYMNPEQQPICDEILNVKLDYFRRAERMQRELMQQTLSGITDEASSTYTVLNTCSWPRTSVVRIAQEKSGKYASVLDAATGKEVPSQRLTTGELAFLATDVAALGSKQYTLSTRKSTLPRTAAPKGNVLDNGIVRVELSPETGDIVRLTCQGEEYADDRSVCGINSYRNLHGNDRGSQASRAYNVTLTPKEAGPVLQSYLIESEAEGCRKLSREVSLVAGQAYVTIENTVDKIATTDKEGIHFGFSFNLDRPAVYTDQPWSVMEVEKDQLSVANRNWMAFQRWLTLSDAKKNVTVCSLNAGMFELGDMTANILGGATLSPEWIRQLRPSSTIYSWALNNHWHTNFPLSQEGMIHFGYRILPGSYDAATSNRFGLEQARPLVAVPTAADYRQESPLKVSADKSVTVSVIKTIDEGKAQIIRLRSVAGTPQTARLTWTKAAPKRLTICQNDHEPGTAAPADGQVTIPPMGFVTVKAEW